MDIARSKRRDNIAEYILYLWQIEDLLRALQFSPEAIYSQLVKPRKIDDPEREEQLLVWYVEMAEMMQEEDKEQVGHLNHTIYLIKDLQNLHQQLLNLPIGERYRELFGSLAPELSRLRATINKSEHIEAEEISDVEICFRALYAVMLYRIKGDKESEGKTTDVLTLISPVISELAKIFGQIERGEIDMFEGA